MKRIQLGEVSTSVTVGFTKAKQHLLPSLVGSILLALAVFIPSTSQATLLTYEGFPYPPIGPLSIDEQGETNIAKGWSANWGQFLGTATAYAITNGSLADPTATLYSLSNSVYTTGGFAGRYFTAPADWALPGFSYYFSILIKPTVTPATNHFYGLQIFSNCGNTGSGYDMLIGKNGSGLNWGLEYSKSPSSCNPATNTTFFDAYSTNAVTANQTVLLVCRVDFNFGTPDVFTLYVNPTPGQPEPTNSPSATLVDDIGTQNGLALNTGNGGAAFFDEVRLGSTFASVVPTTSASDPNLLTWEPFAYNTGFSTGVLDGKPSDGSQGSNGWDNVTWDQFVYVGETNFTFLSGSLSDPSGKLVTSGNSVHANAFITNNATAGRFNIYTGVPTSAKTNANPTYYSVLLRPDNLGSTNIGSSGTAYFEIFGSGGNDLYAGYLFGEGFWGIQNMTNQALSTVPVVSNQTVLLVIRANYAPVGTPFPVKLYINPIPGQPEPASADVTYTYTQTSQANGVAMSVQNGAAATFDEIRVGTNYADVTPAVQVSTNAFVITSIQVLNTTNVVISYLSAAGVTNIVQQNTDLVTGTWTPVGTGVLGTGGTITVTNVVPAATVKRFYRVTHP